MEELLRQLKEALGEDYDETLGQIARDLVVLTARASFGEDVEQELTHVRAQVLNLSAVVQQRTKDVLMAWIAQAVNLVIGAVL